MDPRARPEDLNPFMLDLARCSGRRYKGFRLEYLGEAINAGVFTSSVVSLVAGPVAEAKSHYICGRTETKVRCTIETGF